MYLNPATEEALKTASLSYLEGCRPGWDVEHTLTTVYWANVLIENEGGNPRIIIPAAYTHDIGYCGLLSPGFSYIENRGVKKEHMRRGKRFTREILEKIGNFTPEEINAITYIVGVHDDLHQIANARNHELQILFEADSLAQIDRGRVPGTFGRECNQKSLAEFEGFRARLFRTETGKYYRDIFLPLANHFSDEEPENDYPETFL